MRSKTPQIFTPVANFKDPFEKRENYAVSLRKTKKKERIFTKRSAYYCRQIRSNPEEEVVEGSPIIMKLINQIITGKCSLLSGLTQIEQHM